MFVGHVLPADKRRRQSKNTPDPKQSHFSFHQPLESQDFHTATSATNFTNKTAQSRTLKVI